MCFSELRSCSRARCAPRQTVTAERRKMEINRTMNTYTNAINSPPHPPPPSQPQDASLRRMVYLFIKEVAESCDRGDVIIVTQSLTKDMNSDVDLYRSNAIRVLARIVDAGMLGAIERYIKQAIVDRHPLVSSSALISASHFFESSPESANIVRR